MSALIFNQPIDQFEYTELGNVEFRRNLRTNVIEQRPRQAGQTLNNSASSLASIRGTGGAPLPMPTLNDLLQNSESNSDGRGIWQPERQTPADMLAKFGLSPSDMQNAKELIRQLMESGADPDEIEAELERRLGLIRSENPNEDGPLPIANCLRSAVKARCRELRRLAFNQLKAGVVPTPLPCGCTQNAGDGSDAVDPSSIDWDQLRDFFADFGLSDEQVSQSRDVIQKWLARGETATAVAARLQQQYGLAETRDGPISADRLQHQRVANARGDDAPLPSQTINWKQLSRENFPR